MPRASITPGRKFSTTTSAVSASRRKIAWPSGRLISRVRERLLRFAERKKAQMPLTGVRVLELGRRRAAIFAALGLLDLGYVGAEIVERDGAGRTREVTTEIEYAYPGQWHL